MREWLKMATVVRDSDLRSILCQQLLSIRSMQKLQSVEWIVGYYRGMSAGAIAMAYRLQSLRSGSRGKMGSHRDYPNT